ncbi:MAG: nicotinamide-nucleotide amidohydrolase family protein [Clostridia bacterium]|nr:nicotinamide-nucleotide amidohydrolase family protein [Clostridia bacterium]
MKTAVAVLRPKGKISSINSENVEKVLSAGGISVGSVEFLIDGDSVDFKRRLSYLRDNADNLIVVSEGKLSFDEKAVIAELFDDELVENENAARVAGEDGEFTLMPSGATLIPNPDGKSQGFLCEEEEFSLAYLPCENGGFSYFCESYLIPYFNEKYSINAKTYVFKYFGDEKSLTSALENAKNLCDGKLLTAYSESHGDFNVKLTFNNVDENTIMSARRNVANELVGKIYADCDATLGEVLFNLLRLNNVKVSVAESFTGGRVVSEIIKNSGASAYVMEGIVSYSNKSKMKRLKVKEETLAAVGAVSSKVAYQMAAGLLMSGDCDLAISTTGIAGPKSDDTFKPVGLNYIGVGTKDGVHVYRYELKGDREEITETAKNTALFLAIKNLKNYKG